MFFVVKFIDKDSKQLVSSEFYSTRSAAEKAMRRRTEDFIETFVEVYYKEEDEEQFECIGTLEFNDQPIFFD